VFIDAFTQALWVGVGFSALGCAAALLAPGRRRSAKAVPAPAVLATHEPAGETTG
jgi:hypothetical protein